MTILSHLSTVNVLYVCCNVVSFNLSLSFYLKRVCGFWRKKSKLCCDPWWTRGTAEETTDFAKTQPHTIHNVTTLAEEKQVIWIPLITILITLKLFLTSGLVLFLKRLIACELCCPDDRVTSRQGPVSSSERELRHDTRQAFSLMTS